MTAGAQSPPGADLRPPLEDRDERDVSDPDRSHEEGDHGEREQQVGEGLTHGRPRRERVGRPADEDLLRIRTFLASARLYSSRARQCDPVRLAVRPEGERLEWVP